MIYVADGQTRACLSCVYIKDWSVMQNVVYAVLCCATLLYAIVCSVCRIKAKLVWVLSFVLAPYAHILSQATHKTDAHRFAESVMPRLLEQRRAQQPAALQDTSGTYLALLVSRRFWPSPELYLYIRLLFCNSWCKTGECTGSREFAHLGCPAR